MVQFKNFQLRNAELVYGGDILTSIWSTADAAGPDYLDTESGTLIIVIP